MSVSNFLSTLKKQVATSSGPFRFVTGNQSSDLDSVISAIAYSFFAHAKKEFFIPLINIPRADLRLRRDIVSVLKAHSINEELLYFVDDLKKIINNRTDTEIVLVDHCNLQGNDLIEMYQQQKLSVVGIIDHHQDENFALDANPRIVQSNGSCSSLVFNYWYDILQESNEFYRESNIISMLLAPLLIDTSNMTQKVELGDEIAFKHYMDILGGFECESISFLCQSSNKVSDSLEQYYKQIKKEKKNVSGFSVTDLLRKDYKQFKFESKNAEIVTIGFSSLGKSASWILKTYLEDQILKECSEMIKANDLDLLIITPSYTRKDNNVYTREFCYSFNKEAKYARFFDNDLWKMVTSLELHTEVYQVQSNVIQDQTMIFKIYNQGNIAASRKQIVPAVKQVIESTSLA